MRGGLWTISLCFLFMSPVLVFKVWWWSFLAFDRRISGDFLALALSLIPLVLAIASFIKLGAWVFSSS